MRASSVHSYGFRIATSTAEVTGLIRELLHIASVWDLPLLVSAQDVETAFDSMPHELIAASMAARG
eukprot:1315377-Karenia_brevis.AAC.1